jgi:general secretion pathway protein D
LKTLVLKVTFDSTLAARLRRARKRGSKIVSLLLPATVCCLAACASVSPPSPQGLTLPEPVGRSIPRVAPQESPPLAVPAGAAAAQYAGGGAVVQPSPKGTGQAVDVGDGEITLNFVEADVREVLRAVLGDVLHSNYVVDPKVQATITVQTSRPLRQADVLPMLQQVLRASGLTLVETAGVYRVIPFEEAARNGGAAVTIGTAPAGGREGSSFNVQVIPLRYASAADLLRVVEPFMPKGAVLEADTTRNVLIMSGTSQDLSTVLDLARSFDVDWLSGMSYAVVPLRTGSARAVVDELNAVFGPNGTLPLPGLLRIAPLERMNAVLLVSPQRAYLDQARMWVERLDAGDEENTPQVFQYRVENSRATELARVLTALISGGQARNGAGGLQTAPGTTATEIASSAGSPISTPGFGAPGGGGGSVGAGTAGGFGGGGSLLGPSTPSTSAPGATPAGAPPGTTSSGIGGAPGAGGNAGGGLFGALARGGGNGNGPDAAVIGGGGELPNGSGGGPEFPKARVVADERNNTLLIYTTPRVYRMLEDSLKKLDQPPLQVLIEATIAEVTLTHDLQFGLQWIFKPGKATINFSNLATGTAATVSPGFNAVLGTTRVDVVLNALKAITNVNVISSPQLLVLDRGIATLQVGDQVPILTAQVQSTVTNGAPVVNSIDYRDTGVILRVAPRVNSNGQIALDVAQEVSDVTKTTSSGIDAPTFNRRRIESSVMVQDGETIALGGLIKDNKSFTRNGVPLLSDIPLLGALFRSDDDSTTRTELLILLSPKVVRNAAEARAVTDELRNRLQGLQRAVETPH